MTWVLCCHRKKKERLFLIVHNKQEPLHSHLREPLESDIGADWSEVLANWSTKCWAQSKKYTAQCCYWLVSVSACTRLCARARGMLAQLSAGTEWCEHASQAVIQAWAGHVLQSWVLAERRMLSTWLLICCRRHRWGALNGDMKCYYLFPLSASHVHHLVCQWFRYVILPPTLKWWCPNSLILHCLKNQSSPLHLLWRLTVCNVKMIFLGCWLVVWDTQRAESFVKHFLCSDGMHFFSLLGVWTLTSPLTTASWSSPAGPLISQVHRVLTPLTVK